MARRIGQARVQHLHELGLLHAPLGNGTGVGIGFLVAQFDAGQAVENGFHIVHAHAKTHVHVKGCQFFEQGIVARDDAAHQHVAAAAGVFGQRVYGQVHPQRGWAGVSAAQQIEGVESQTGSPCVVKRSWYALAAAEFDLCDQVGKFERDGASCLQPDQPGCRADFGRQIVDVCCLVNLVPDAQALELIKNKDLVRPVCVVGHQHFVAGVEQGQIHAGNGRQAAGQQQGVLAAFERAQALLQHVAGRRAVRAVGVAAAIQRAAAARFGHVGEKDGGCLVHCWQRCCKALRRLVVVMNQAGDAVLAHGFAGVCSKGAKAICGNGSSLLQGNGDVEGYAIRKLAGSPKRNPKRNPKRISKCNSQRSGLRQKARGLMMANGKRRRDKQTSEAAQRLCSRQKGAFHPACCVTGA